jgi:hypothetical protein
MKSHRVSQSLTGGGGGGAATGGDRSASGGGERQGRGRRVAQDLRRTGPPPHPSSQGGRGGGLESALCLLAPPIRNPSPPPHPPTPISTTTAYTRGATPHAQILGIALRTLAACSVCVSPHVPTHPHLARELLREPEVLHAVDARVVQQVEQLRRAGMLTSFSTSEPAMFWVRILVADARVVQQAEPLRRAPPPPPRGGCATAAHMAAVQRAVHEGIGRACSDGSAVY